MPRGPRAPHDLYSPERRTALVLSGTGADGAYHAGVLSALHEAGVKVDLVAGRGIGALGAVLSRGRRRGAALGAARLLARPALGRSYRWRWPYRAIGLTLLALLAVLAMSAAAARGRSRRSIRWRSASAWLGLDWRRRSPRGYADVRRLGLRARRAADLGAAADRCCCVAAAVALVLAVGGRMGGVAASRRRHAGGPLWRCSARRSIAGRFAALGHRRAVGSAARRRQLRRAGRRAT